MKNVENRVFNSYELDKLLKENLEGGVSKKALQQILSCPNDALLHNLKKYESRKNVNKERHQRNMIYFYKDLEMEKVEILNRISEAVKGLSKLKVKYSNVQLKDKRAELTGFFKTSEYLIKNNVEKMKTFMESLDEMEKEKFNKYMLNTKANDFNIVINYFDKEDESFNVSDFENVNSILEIFVTESRLDLPEIAKAMSTGTQLRLDCLIYYANEQVYSYFDNKNKTWKFIHDSVDFLNYLVRVSQTNLTQHNRDDFVKILEKPYLERLSNIRKHANKNKD